MRKSFTRSWSTTSSRALLVGLASLGLLSGCAGAMPAPQPPMVDVAPAAGAPAAPAAAPAAPAAASAPPGVSRGYAPPSAPPDPAADRAPSAEADTMPATFQQPAPAPRAAPSPAGAPSRPGAPSSAKTAAKAPPPPPKAPPPPPPAKAPPPPRAVAEKAAKGEAPAQGAPAAPSAPMLIYVGDLQVSVDEGELVATLDKVIDVAEALGGYLAGRKDASVQVRIPSYRFREGLTRIEKLGDVLHRSVTADDVSEQYSDLEVRLLNLKATRQRLAEFLARAGTMADMLTVAHELERVSAEIEQIEGKMRFLRSRAAFSLVTVAVQARPKAAVTVAATPPPPPPPREVELPIEWLSRVGISRLLDLSRK